MTSHISVSLEFSFKGETHSLKLCLNLDEHLRKMGHLPDFHLLLARENNIDTYSYLYEVMEVTPLSFSEATGLAADCVKNGHFDDEKFLQLWEEAQINEALQAIVSEQMGITDLSQQPDLLASLHAAYALGKTHRD